MARKGVPTGEEGWLIVARNTTDGEIKYSFSNAGADTPVELMLEVAFRRWRVERSFEDAKGQAGIDHFEVPNCRSLMRHLIMTHVSPLFLMRETHRLREKPPRWSPGQVRLAVEEQLDPDVRLREVLRRLEDLARKIGHWQTCRSHAAVSRRKRRLRELRPKGYLISKMPKCFGIL